MTEMIRKHICIGVEDSRRAPTIQNTGYISGIEESRKSESMTDVGWVYCIAGFDRAPVYVSVW